MKIIEELESLENGESPALFPLDSGLKSECDTLLFDFTAVLVRLNALQLKYPNHRLLIGNKEEWDWSEFALFGEREETDSEKRERLSKENKAKEAKKVLIQRKIDRLTKQASKLGLTVSKS